MEEASNPTRNSSNCFCCRELISLHNFSFKKFCFFLLIFFLITFVIIGLSAFFLIIIIKPHKPVFSVRDVNLDFYEVDDDDNDRNSNQTLLASSVLSLTLNAENHNKFGLGFSPARFHVYHEDFPIGTIRIPRFFQPPHSDDVVVRCRVLLECVNVSKILAKASMTTTDNDESKGNVSEMKILGDAKAHLWFLHLNFLNIKLAMDCNMNVNLKEITSWKNEVHSAKIIKSRLAYALNNSKGITMKCVSALSI